jgi:hypothetical protein
MSRYKKKFSRTFIGNDKVELYDRKTDKTFIGTGLSRKVALEEAFDKLYESEREERKPKDSSSYDSESYSTYNSSKYRKKLRPKQILGYILFFSFMYGGSYLFIEYNIDLITKPYIFIIFVVALIISLYLIVKE